MASWAGAGFTTLYGLPVIRPFARKYVSEVFYADLLAGFSLFIAALILFFLASSIIASWIRNSRLNALDRSLGLLAGLATSIVVLSLSVLVMDKVLKNKNYPPFIKTSKSVPFQNTWSLQGAFRIFGLELTFLGYRLRSPEGIFSSSSQ